MKLVSSVLVDVAALPLHLPYPDGINNGGYIGPEGYSNIDLLVAGLEARRIGEKVTNLAQFFDSHPEMISERWVMLSVLDDKEMLLTCTINEYKSIIRVNKEYYLLQLFIRNAPLTFKWVTI